MCMCVWVCVCMCVWVCVCVRARVQSKPSKFVSLSDRRLIFSSMGAWSSGACSVTCGHGVMRRWRSCIPGSAGSPPMLSTDENGLHNTTEKCFLRSCPAGNQEGGHAATGEKKSLSTDRFWTTLKLYPSGHSLVFPFMYTNAILPH